MNGNKVVMADTNVVLYLLSGNLKVVNLLHQKIVSISFITELELLGYAGNSADDLRDIQKFIDKCIVVEMNTTIKKTVIDIRQHYKIKLPDAIVAASAIVNNYELVTADKGFEKIKSLKLNLLNF